MRNWGRDDPERDWEDFCERNEDHRPIIGICPVCGEPVRDGDKYYEKDDAYELDTDVIHRDCIYKYLDANGYRI